jgi:PAS domain S-box-containing protein
MDGGMADEKISTVKINKGMTVSHYTIIEEPDGGYPDDVFLATDNNLERKVLLQFMPSDKATDRKAMTTFRKEAQAIAAIGHPNLVSIYEVEDFQGRPFVAMEYPGGRTLFDILREGGLSSRHALDIAIQICATLIALNDAGIVPLGIRPSLISVSKTYQIQLLMLGHLFSAVTASRKSDPAVAGFPDYLSPEEVAGDKPDHQSSVFILGIILYEMLTGKHPFRSQSPEETMRAIAEAALPAVRDKTRIPKELNLVIEKALGKERESRYLRLDYLKDDLECAHQIHSLQESEEQYRNVVERANDGICIIQNKLLRFINRRLANMVGYTVEEGVNTLFADYIHPEEIVRVVEKYNLQISGRETSQRYETVLVHKNGNLVPVEINAGLITYEGHPAILAIVRDISDRVQAETALKESEQKFSDLFQHSNDAIFIHNMEGDIIDVNQRSLNLFQYTKPELLNMKIGELHPASAREVSHNAFKILSEKGFVNFEIDFRKKDGNLFSAEVSSSRIQIGDKKVVQGIVRDITDRKRTEAHLQLLSSIVKQTTEGVALVDMGGNLQFVNKAFAEMHGYSPEELLRKNLTIFHTPEQLPSVEAANRQIKDTGSFSGEIWHTRRDGTTFPSYMNNSLMYGSSGEPVGMIGIMRDISDRKRAENELRSAHEQLNATLNALPDLLFELDQHGRIYDFRAPHPELLYRPPEEFLGKTMKEVLPKDVADAVERAIQETVETGQSSGITYPLELQGKICWFELSSATRGDPKTPEGRLTMLVRDITDRKMAEKALRESEEKYRRVFEDSVLGLYRTTPDGEVLMVNPALLKMLGYSSFDDLASRNLEDSGYEPGYERSTFKDQIESDGMVVGLESAWIKKDGTALHVRESARAIRDGDGNTRYYEGTVEDITERKLAEKEIARAAKVIEQERNMFVTGPVVVFKWRNRPGWPVEYVSPNVSDVFGYTVEDLVTGQIAYAEIIPEEDIDTVLDEVNAYSERGVESFSHQPYRVIRKDGIAIWVADYTTILHDNTGKITHYLGYVIDITERKLAEDMLRRRTEQLNNERKALKDKNIALNQVLGQIESQRQDYQRQVYKDVETALTPFLRRLRDKTGSDLAKEYKALEENFYAILAKDLDDFTGRYARLTSRESEICDMIKHGQSSKQISESLNLSVLTVMKHREQIRKKLGITNKSVNLATYLRSH